MIAAEIKTTATDVGFLGPTVAVARRELERAGVTDPPDVVFADSGCWHNQQMDEALN